MNDSLWEQDLKGSKVIDHFLDEYFYEIYFKKNKSEIISAERVPYIEGDTNKEQYSGIDFKYKIKNRNGETKSINIDEKCALYNPGIDTFAFELKSKNKDGQWVNGWFLKENLKTDFYLLAWPVYTNDFRREFDKDKYKAISNLKFNDIKALEILMVNTKKIKNKIFSDIGLDKDYLKSKTDYIIKNNKFRVTKINNNSEIRFFYSYYLDEEPVNLIINKNLIKKCQRLHWNIKIVKGKPQYEKI